MPPVPSAVAGDLALDLARPSSAQYLRAARRPPYRVAVRLPPALLPHLLPTEFVLPIRAGLCRHLRWPAPLILYATCHRAREFSEGPALSRQYGFAEPQMLV